MNLSFKRSYIWKTAAIFRPLKTPLAAASLCFTAVLIRAVVFSYIGAGVVRQCAIVGQGDVFLLPLLVQRAPASLPEDALSKTTAEEVTQRTASLNLPKFRVSTTIPSKCGCVTERVRWQQLRAFILIEHPWVRLERMKQQKQQIFMLLM